VLKTATATAGAVTKATNTVHWNGALKNGETASITIEAEVLASVAPETTIANQATVHFDSDGDGVNEGSAGSIPDGAVTAGPTTFTTEKAALPDAGVDGGTNGGPTSDGGDSGCSVGGTASSSRSSSWLGGLILGVTLALRRRRSPRAELRDGGGSA
jgi:MYXO-CTERM domain-containing protein